MNNVVAFPSSTATKTAKAAVSPERAERSATSAREAIHDAELVQRFNAGEEKAFNEIVSRYRDKIFQITQNMLHNAADAEEVTQDTFIRAYRGLNRFRGDSSLATWLHRIALNLARNRYWYFYRRCRHTTLALDCPLGEDSDATFTDLVADQEADPSRVAAIDEFSSLIDACMEKLPASHREILTQRNIQHHSYEEIAQSIGITEGTVKSRIARAREKMRQLLGEMCPEFATEANLAAWFETNRQTGRVGLAAA